MRKILRPPVEGRIESVPSACYVRITSEQHRRGHDWRMIEAHCLDCCGRLLMPKGEVIPTECDLRPFVPSQFSRRMMENLTLEILASSQLPPNRRKLALYGRESEIVALLPVLVPLIGELRIITRRSHALSDIVSDITGSTGMPITMTDTLDASGYHILLAPFGGAAVIGISDDMLVIAPDRPRGDHLEWISGTSVNIPEELRGAYRDYYDPFTFVAAFYEIAGLRNLGQVIPAGGVSASGIFTPRQLADMIDIRHCE